MSFKNFRLFLIALVLQKGYFFPGQRKGGLKSNPLRFGLTLGYLITGN